MRKNKKTIKEVLEKNFSKSDKAEFYFVKGLKQFSKIVVVKTKKYIEDDKVIQVRSQLRKKLRDNTLDLLQWIDTVGGLIPKKNIYKIPFFTTEDIKEYNSWRICPVGEYWVRRHARQKKTTEDVDGHCRKNHKGRDLIKGDEIEEISQTKKFQEIKIKTGQGIINKHKDSEAYNDLITGWTAYWNDQFKIEPPLNPNLVKVLIATESGFDPKEKNPNNPPNIGPARGLMQITVDTQNRLSGKGKELKNHFVVLTDEDIYDPNKNICAGIRWLFRKRETAQARLKREPTWEEVVMEFKGRLKSKTQTTHEIKEKIETYLRVLDEK